MDNTYLNFLASIAKFNTKSPLTYREVIERDNMLKELYKVIPIHKKKIK